MFNSKYFKIWITLFVILLAVLFFVLIPPNKKSVRDIKREIVDVNTNEINKLTFHMPDAEFPISLVNSIDGWKISADGGSFDADTIMIKRMLKSCANMKSLRVASTDKKRWAEFKVADTNAIFLEYFINEKKVAGLYVGDYSYLSKQSQNAMQANQGQGLLTTFVREEGDVKTHSVEGYLKSFLTHDIKYYRRKGLFRARKSTITRVYAEFADGTSYDIRRVQPGKFTIDGVPADTNAISKFFHSADNINSRDLVDDVNPALLPKSYDMIRFESENMDPVVIKAYPVNDERNYILTSTMNPGAYFSDPIERLYRMIFKSRDFYFGKAPR